MPRAKQASKRKVAKQQTAPILGAAGLSLIAGGASAATVPVATVPAMNAALNHQEVTLGEEEVSDVNLGTFYVFDKEGSAESTEGLVQLARGGCRGCGGRGCRGCGRGCGFGCGGCSCTCCASWGACRWC